MAGSNNYNLFILCLQLTTNRRIFQLMTLRDSNRREWLNKIRDAKSLPLSKD